MSLILQVSTDLSLVVFVFLFLIETSILLKAQDLKRVFFVLP